MLHYGNQTTFCINKCIIIYDLNVIRNAQDARQPLRKMAVVTTWCAGKTTACTNSAGSVWVHGRNTDRTPGITAIGSMRRPPRMPEVLWTGPGAA